MEKKKKTKTGAAQLAAVKKWNEKQAQIAIRVAPATKGIIDAHIKSKGEKLAPFIVRACLAQIERDQQQES